MEPAVGAWCGASEVCFRLHDHDRRLSAVRLVQGVVPASPDFAYDPASCTWELRLPRPPVHRIEYKLDLRYPDGGAETVCDPDNPRRIGGGYGESSVLWCGDYREPDWLRHPQAAGAWRDVDLPLPAVRSEIVARIWSPDTPTGNVLVAHDGPDFQRYGQLARYTAAMIGANRVPPYHLVLLPPGERLEWYSANPAYARAVAADVLPKLAAELGTERPVVGVGASLGAAYTAARYNQPFDLDATAASVGYPMFMKPYDGGAWVGVSKIRNAVEENLANNRDMADTLRRHGYPVTFVEVPDAHNWTGWRDALDPHLTSLLQRLFS